MSKLKNLVLVFFSLFLFSCSTTSDMDAVPLRYSEPRFQTTAPIELDVEKVEITSDLAYAIKDSEIILRSAISATGTPVSSDTL